MKNDYVASFFKNKFFFITYGMYFTHILVDVYIILHNKMCESPHVCLLNVSCCKKKMWSKSLQIHIISIFFSSAHCMSFYKFLCAKVPYVYQMNFLWFTDIKPDGFRYARESIEKGNCEEKWFLTNWISKDFQIKQDKWKSHFASLQS